jgi:hypothetical protein
MTTEERLLGGVAVEHVCDCLPDVAIKALFVVEREREERRLSA